MNTTTSYIKQWSVSTAEFAHRSDGIVEFRLKPFTKQHLADQQEVLLSMIKELGSELKWPLMVVVAEESTVTTEARDYARKVEYLTPISALGIVVLGRTERLLAASYYILNKPSIPYKIFSSEEEASQWLPQFLPVK